ncbi:MAG: hypothetical protein M5T61_19060 [Acidimicrobiia bacterium]|nr:hypothetical protein [Acidimicrobiia bacterium]
MQSPATSPLSPQASAWTLPRGNALTIEQARTFLDSIHGHRLEAAFTVALALGLRRGELLGLTWDGVDLDADPPRLTVTRSLKRIRSNNGDPSTLALADTKTARSRRTIPLPARVAATFERTVAARSRSVSPPAPNGSRSPSAQISCSEPSSAPPRP